jgi:hypothetical protein
MLSALAVSSKVTNRTSSTIDMFSPISTVPVIITELQQTVDTHLLLCVLSSQSDFYASLHV